MSNIIELLSHNLFIKKTKQTKTLTARNKTNAITDFILVKSDMAPSVDHLIIIGVMKEVPRGLREMLTLRYNILINNERLVVP